MMITDLIHSFGILGANLILIFMNKVLILGSNGMLGTMVAEYFLNLKEYEIFLTNRVAESKDINNKTYKFDVLVDDLEGLLTDNRIFKQRNVEIGVVSKQEALDHSFSESKINESINYLESRAMQLTKHEKEELYSQYYQCLIKKMGG